MTLRKWGPRVRQDRIVNSGGEYFVSWFVGQIAENAVSAYRFKVAKLSSLKLFPAYVWWTF